MFYFIFEKSEDFSCGFRKIEEFDRKGKKEERAIISPCMRRPE